MSAKYFFYKLHVNFSYFPFCRKAEFLIPLFFFSPFQPLSDAGRIFISAVKTNPSITLFSIVTLSSNEHNKFFFAYPCIFLLFFSILSSLYAFILKLRRYTVIMDSVISCPYRCLSEQCNQCQNHHRRTSDIK